MIISSIITEVLQEVGGDVDDTAAQAILLTCAKGALRRFPLYTRARIIVNISYATLSAGANYLTTPTLFLRERSIYWLENGVKRFITKLTDDELGRRRNTNTTGTILYYRIIKNVIEFDKSAGGDVVIYVEHFIEVDDLTAATTFFGNTSLAEILKDGMKYTYYSDYTEDDKKADKKLALFKSGLDEVDAQFMMSEHGGYIDEA